MTMTKSEFLEVLLPELKRLKDEEHVIDLLANGYADLADNVVYDNKINYTYIDLYLLSGDEKIGVQDIPKNYLEVFIIYLWGSGHKEDKIISCQEEFKEVLEKAGSVGKKICEKLKKHKLTEFESLSKLMAP